MAAPSQTAEQRELALIGKVEMRIALADTDTKLEATLKTYLAPLLLKLASPHNAVRNKVISVCSHVNTRIKPQSIQLPVESLIKQFKEQDSPSIRLFDLSYIQQGIPRLSSLEKANLLPLIVANLSNSGKHGATIFYLLLRVLDSFPLPDRGSPDDASLRSRLGVSADDAQYLASWSGKFMLFVPQQASSQQSCPGLSPDDYAFFISKDRADAWNPAAGGLNLHRCKVLVARLLASGLFTEQERFLPALFASSDSASALSDIGEDMLKRSLPTVDLEDESLIRQLFELYFGKDSMPRVKAPLRLRILGLLGKSKTSTTFSSGISRLVRDGVASPSTDGGDVIMGNTPTSSKIGLETTKLRAAIFAYVNFVARNGDPETLHAIAPEIITRLRDFVEDQGWPRPGPAEDLTSRAYAYEVIGLLSKAGPRSLLVEEEHPSLDLLRWIFSALARDSSPNSLVVSLEEALSTVLSAFSRLELTTEEQSILEELLVDQMSDFDSASSSDRVRSTKYVAARFANRCLPYSSVNARWIDILGLGSKADRAELQEESERGLSPYWHRMLTGLGASRRDEPIIFPAFEDIIERFFPGRTVSDSAQAISTARVARTKFPTSFNHMTTYARRVLFQHALSAAGIEIEIDNDWERRIDVAVENDPKSRTAVKSAMVSLLSTARGSLQKLLAALFVDLVDGTSASVDDQLAELLALSPDNLVEEIAVHVRQLLPVLQSNHRSRRMAAARAYGIIGSHNLQDRSIFETSLDCVSAAAVSPPPAADTNQAHGALTMLGFLFSRSYHRAQSFDDHTTLRQLIQNLVKILISTRDTTMQEASCIALGQLSMYRAITPALLEEFTTIRALTDRLYEIAKKDKELAVLAMGQVSMILTEGSHDLLHLLDQLYKLHELRHAEIQLTVGEALSYVASGWRSQALVTKLDVPGSMPDDLPREKTCGTIIDHVLADCAHSKPALKKAAVIWLMCLVQYCGEQPAVQARLPRCQVAFKRCLSDRDELVQESASRGLGLVYEKGDKALKEDLVRDLVSSFSSDQQSTLSGNVSADTQLFEPGALPTGDGSVSTYKDIMSLASEVGDSSLVYKFMAMASSNALWSSRAAFGRFGLSNVLSSSSVDGYLANNPKLYPKLFRYRFDPNTGVQRSMNDIWNAMVKDSTATIDQHFDAIMEYLLTAILGKEWRTRQASCAAIADLVQGRPVDRYEKYLERIWTQCFKVLDDIKESVRAAASSLARVLTGVLTRTLEFDHSATRSGTTMLTHVLPFLLSGSGMESSAEDVRLFAVRTLLEIVKKGNGGTLRPFIPELVERLIGSLSALEPEAVNYLHLNAAKYNLTEQKIDDMRLSSIRSSPLMDAIERCLDLLDEQTMQLLQPRLEKAMKSAVGLPSKVGSSRVLVSLVTRQLHLFRSHADFFLRLITKVVMDRNETVSSSYAMASGYVARAATDRQILQLFSFAQKLYFESEGDRAGAVPRHAIASGEIMFAVAKHASDRFNALAVTTLPFVFVAKHDDNEHVREQFQNTWNEAVGGSRAVVLYLKEIIELSLRYIDSAQWHLKHTSARAIADCVTSAAALDKELSPSVAATLWPALEKALGGKTWDGKKDVLTAFVKFAESAQTWVSQDARHSELIMKIAVRESKRQNEAYRIHAIRALGKISLAQGKIDAADTVLSVVSPLMQDLHETALGEMDIEKDATSHKPEDVRQETFAAAMETALASISIVAESPDEAQVRTTAAKALGLVQFIQSPSTSVLRNSFTSLTATMKRISKARGHIDFGSDAEPHLKTILFEWSPTTEALRLLRADSATATLEACVPSSSLGQMLISKTRALVTAEPSRAVRDCLERALVTVEKRLD